MDTWIHSELGEFEADDWRWEQTRELDAFKTLFPNSEAKLPLTLDVYDENQVGVEGLPQPSDEIITLTKKVLTNLEDLVKSGIEMLWKDFHGEGDAASGMWWHDAIDEVFEYEFGPQKPDDAEGLYPLLTPLGIDVVSEAYMWNGPAARITFNAEFEEEHGISILTDGEKVIGLGYMMDSLPFAGMAVEN